MKGKIKKAIIDLDYLFRKIICKFTTKRKILFYGFNVMNYSMFKPLYEKISKYSNTDVYFCFSNSIRYNGNEAYKYNISADVIGVDRKYILNRRQIRYKKWDLVFAADFPLPWISRHSIFVQIFHGIAAKSIDCDGEKINYNFHPSMKKFDICFFINKIYFNKSKELGLWKKPDTGEVTGMCSTDVLVNSNHLEKINQIKKSLIPPRFIDKNVILYAPTWGKQNSLYEMGRQIISCLAKLNAFVIIKPHPRCATHGIKGLTQDLKGYVSSKFKNDNFIIIDDSPYDALLVADVLISDFGSLALEATLLKMPIYLFLNKKNVIDVVDGDQISLIKKCCFNFSEKDILNEDFFFKKIDNAKINAMTEFSEKYFKNHGTATDASFDILVNRKLLCPTHEYLVLRNQFKVNCD